MDSRIETIFRTWEAYDAELSKEQKVDLKDEFHNQIEDFLKAEGLDGEFDRWEFIRQFGEAYRNWRRRPH